MAVKTEGERERESRHYEDVLEADVAMSDAQRVQVIDGAKQLLQYVADAELCVAEPVAGHDSVEQITSLHVRTSPHHI